MLKTFKKLSSERVPSECSKSRYIGELYLLTPKIPSERVPSECSQRRYIGELYLLSKKPPQIRIVNGHRENNSFIVALIQIIIYLQSKAKSKQEMEANANMTTAQIVRLSFKKS